MKNDDPVNPCTSRRRCARQVRLHRVRVPFRLHAQGGIGLLGAHVWLQPSHDARPQDSKTAALRNMLMVRRNYDALVSGDGSCAGCGEKSILRAVAAVTEAYMRPIYHVKADRFTAKAAQLEQAGTQKLAELKERSRPEYELFARPSPIF